MPVSTNFNVQNLNNLVFTSSLGADPYVAAASGINNLGGGNVSVDTTEFFGSFFDTTGPDPGSSIKSVKINNYSTAAPNIIEYTYTYGDGHVVPAFGGVVVAENADMFLVDQITGFTPINQAAGTYSGTPDPGHYVIFSNVDLSQSETYNDGTTPAPGPTLPLNFGATADYSFNLRPTYSSQSPPSCVVGGTHILTPRGEVPVEALKVGDSVTLASGGTSKVVWIGHRDLDFRQLPMFATARPVRIAPGAFADDRPSRPLLLSPDHAIYAEGVLIPARCLINGTSVVHVEVDEITYYHVELERHAIMVADGLDVESYLDTGHRDDFENGTCPVVVGADFAALAWETRGCLPLVVTGPAHAAVHARVARRAATLAVLSAAELAAPAQ